MRLFIGILALGILGCCLSPTPAPAPPPATAPPAPSALTQALAGMTEAPSTPGAPAPSDAAPPADLPASNTPSANLPAPSAPPTDAASPACLDARAGLELARADVVSLRATAGGATSQQVESTGAAIAACNASSDCLTDTKLRMARIDAYDRAQAALEADRGRLAQAELGIFEANRRVSTACGAP